MEDPTEDTEIQEETEAPPDPEPLENSAPEPEPEPEPEPPPKKKPKKYEKADCQKCGKTMSLNTLRYKHKCSVEEEPPPPPPKKAASKRREDPPPKAKPVPKKRAQVREVVEEDPETPRTQLRNLYAQVRLQQMEERRNRFRGFLD